MHFKIWNLDEDLFPANNNLHNKVKSECVEFV